MHFLEYITSSVDECLKYDGVGKQIVNALKMQNFNTLWDVINYKPRKVQTVVVQSLSYTAVETYMFLQITLLQLLKVKNHYIITFQDHTGLKGKILLFTKKLTFPYVQNKQMLIYGKVKFNTMVHPKVITDNQQILQQYFLSPPLFDATFQKLVKSILSQVMVDYTFSYKEISQITRWSDLFLMLHFGTLAENHKALDVLKTLEGIAYQHTMKQKNQQKTCDKMCVVKDDYKEVYEQIVSTLTTCQSSTMQQIVDDFSASTTVQRMIFGDVGTGKTRLAILSAIHAVSANKQVIFLAPTTLLANQVMQVFTNTLPMMKIALLTQQTIKKYKSKHFAQQIVIGTHAVFQESITFENIGLIIIDEQHKFGVQQRYNLINKANQQNAHLLSLSATPIPRTLMMVMQNYLKVSVLHTKPKPHNVKTFLATKSNVNHIIDKLNELITPETMMYWICPAVSDEEEELDYINANDRYNSLLEKFPTQVALLHGQMNKNEQAEIYQKTLNKEINILVATTIVEVGVDLSHATVIVIEDAHRFGLAQLHQLRGRVGRGGLPGKCILIHPDKPSAIAKERLQALKTINNGFLLAEKDMELRGHGNIFGTQQSGLWNFNYLSLPNDIDIFNHIVQQKYTQMNMDDLIKLFFSSEMIQAG